MRVWANKRMDMPLSVWISALTSCVQPRLRDSSGALERSWEPDGSGVAGLSVRSLFDLWLRAQGWRPGDRIVFSAFTVAKNSSLFVRYPCSIINPDTRLSIGRNPSTFGSDEVMDFVACSNSGRVRSSSTPAWRDRSSTPRA